MSVIELLLALQVNDFAVPPASEVNAAVNTMMQCEQAAESRPECTGPVDTIIQLKQDSGGPYVEFQ